MAERALKLIFNDSTTAGKEVQITVPKADDTLDGSVIRGAMNAIYANKEVFALDLGTVKAAKFLTPSFYTPVSIG